MSLLFDIDDQPAQAFAGLTYIPEYIGAADEQALLEAVDSEPWSHDLKRRVQHYGYRYDYKARSVTKESYLGPLPGWLRPMADKLQHDRIFPAAPDQVIVNEYLPGQGIAPHIDCEPCFDDVIASLTLGSGATMQFTHPGTGQREAHYLKPRSLIVLSGPARYDWQHGIPARKSDSVDGLKVPRERRVSLTFRTVILDETGVR